MKALQLLLKQLGLQALHHLACSLAGSTGWSAGSLVSVTEQRLLILLERLGAVEGSGELVA